MLPDEIDLDIVLKNNAYAYTEAAAA